MEKNTTDDAIQYLLIVTLLTEYFNMCEAARQLYGRPSPHVSSQCVGWVSARMVPCANTSVSS